MIINVSQVMHSISSNQKQTSLTKKTIENKNNTLSLSLEAYDLYIFLPLWQQVTKKFLENAQYYFVSQAWSSGGGVEMAPWTKTSVDVDGSGGVGAGAGCPGAVGAVAGADDVALVSVKGTAANL